MPETISDIAGGAAHYATLILWEADKDGDITAANAEAAELYANLSDNANILCDLAGWITDADSYIAIRNAASVARLSTNPLRAGQAITLTQNRLFGARYVISVSAGAEFTRISGLDLITDHNGNATHCLLVNLGASNTIADVRIFDCVTYQANVGRYGIMFTEANDTIEHLFYVWNCLCYSHGWSGIFSANIGSDHIIYSYNNAVYGCNEGINEAAGIINCYNTICYDNTVLDFGGFPAGDYNMSEDATAPGPNSLTSVTGGNIPAFVNVGAGVEDFHLQITSDAIDSGQGDADGGGKPSARFSNDIDGSPRPAIDAEWDMGPHELQFPAPAGAPRSLWLPPSRRWKLRMQAGELEELGGTGFEYASFNGDAPDNYSEAFTLVDFVCKRINCRIWDNAAQIIFTYDGINPLPEEYVEQGFSKMKVVRGFMIRNFVPGMVARYQLTFY